MGDQWAIDKGRKTLGSQSIRINHLQDWIERDSLVADAISGTRRVPCPAGSLLLWDSRTIHQGWAGGPRLAQPVCWEPRTRREQDIHALGRKIFMCASGIPSSHSSAEARIHGMAQRSSACQVLASEGMPAMRAGQILPYCIAEAEEHRQTWEELQQWLWRARRDGDPCETCRGIMETLKSLLKPEVFSTL